MFTCIECLDKYDKSRGDTEERMCYKCLDKVEEEYSVTIKATFCVMAKSKEEAERYILDQFYSGNRAYTESVHIKKKSNIKEI